MFKKMQAKLDQLERNSSQNNSGHNTGGNDIRGKTGGRKRKTPDNPHFSRRTTDKYCWTHGACAHDSAHCTAKANGHQDSATFENKLGGSKAFCG